MKKTILLFTLLLATVSAHAQFEGILHMKMTGTHVQGTSDAYISKPGMRQEMKMQSGNMPIAFTVLMNFKTPNFVYTLNDKDKTYTKTDVTKAQKTKTANEKFTVKPLGTLTVAGYSCKNMLVTTSQGTDMEMCLTKDIVLDYELYAKLRDNNERDQRSGSLMKALKDAGAEGYPVRTAHKGRGDEMIIELVKAESKSLPASLFQVPADYTETAGGMGHAGAPPMPPESKAKMDEAMKNMSPEQRAMVEKMMKH